MFKNMKFLWAFPPPPGENKRTA
eukprot:COSAG01_NODE_61776_length_288_cov_0.238095_1_plen_22_part_10